MYFIIPKQFPIFLPVLESKGTRVFSRGSMVVSTPPRPPIDTTTNDDPNNDNNNGHNNIDEAVETEHSGVKVNIMNNPNSYCGGSPRVFFGPIRPIEFPLNTLDMNRRKTLVMGVVPVSGFSCSDVTAAAVVEELGGGDGGDDDDDDNDSNDDDVVFQPQQRPRIPTPSLPSTQTATSVHITPPTNLLLSDWILTQIIRWRQRAAAPRLNASEVACLRIQAAIRMWSARTRFLGLRQSLVRLQRKWRAVRAQLALSSRAAASATKIQRFWRQRLVFLELKRNLALQFQVESAAARRIQACWSNLVSRRNQLMTITTLHRILSNISARKIQLAWRRNIAVMLAEASNRRIKLEACRRSVACTLIQRCWRQYHERHSAAKLIQRSWKSYQRSLQLHHAVSIIQTWWIRFRRSCSSSIVSRGSQLPFPVSSSSFPSSSSSSVMKLDQQEQLQQASLYASDKTVSEYSSPVTPVLESAATPMTPSTSSLLTIPASTKSTGGLNLNLV